jgi:predicted dehydrogenase
MHVGPAVAFAELGYHILLEKPMAVSAKACRQIEAAVTKANVLLCVCHVLRYTPYTAKMVELIRKGVIGDIINVMHLEPVGSWHFAHSYVRGPWRREDESSFMLMTKCCHDIDLIRYLVGAPCVKVSSFGALSHFHAGKRPAGASDRCLSCSVESTCPFSAKRIYLDPVKHGHTGWPVSMVTERQPTVPDVEEALRSGPYGRCVYACDNDVCDHQTVSMEFEGGITATLTAVAFTEKICQRQTRIFGTRGELTGNGEDEITWYDFVTQKRQLIRTDMAPPSTLMTGHGGADYHLTDSFVRSVRTKLATYVLSGPRETLESHLIVFAAEASRRAGVVVDVARMMETTLLDAVVEALGPGGVPSHGLLARLRVLQDGPEEAPSAPLGEAFPPASSAPIAVGAAVFPPVSSLLAPRNPSSPFSPSDVRPISELNRYGGGGTTTPLAARRVIRDMSSPESPDDDVPMGTAAVHHSGQSSSSTGRRPGASSSSSSK